MELWIEDPVTKQLSVSLTLAVFCTVIIVGVGFLNIYGKVGSLGPFENMFWSSWALYLGRRLNINGKTYSSDQVQQEIKEVTGS
jgi:hypothetical protein